MGVSESEAFALYDQWFPKLRYIAWRVTHDHYGAEDIAQKAALDLLRTLRRGNVVDKPRQWLEAVVRNRAIDWYRAHERLNTHEAHPTDLMTPTDESEADVWDAITEPLPSAEERVIARLAALQLLTLLAQTGDYRTQSAQLIERTADGWRARDLAKAEGVSEMALKRRLARARAQIRKRLTA